MVAAKYVVSVLEGKFTDVAEGKEPGECLPCFFMMYYMNCFLTWLSPQLDSGRLWVERRSTRHLQLCEIWSNHHVCSAAPIRQAG